jgi:hypothetical protein
MDETARSELDKLFAQRKTRTEEKAAEEAEAEKKRKSAAQTFQELCDRVIRPELQELAQYLRKQSYQCQLIEWPKDGDSRYSCGISLILGTEDPIPDGETWIHKPHIQFRDRDGDSIIVEKQLPAARSDLDDRHHDLPKSTVTRESVRHHAMTVLRAILPP